MCNSELCGYFCNSDIIVRFSLSFRVFCYNEYNFKSKLSETNKELLAETLTLRVEGCPRSQFSNGLVFLFVETWLSDKNIFSLLLFVCKVLAFFKQKKRSFSWWFYIFVYYWTWDVDEPWKIMVRPERTETTVWQHSRYWIYSCWSAELSLDLPALFYIKKMVVVELGQCTIHQQMWCVVIYGTF